MSAPLSYPGEYPGHLTRKTIFNVPMVSGYATSRMRVVSGRPTPLVSGLEDNQIQGVFENTGTSNFTLQMRQTDDRSVSGTRTDIGAALNIVPGGRRTVTFSPWQSYLETYCTAGGGQVKAQLSSKIKWEQMAFDKLDTFYPPQIWQVDSEEGI